MAATWDVDITVLDVEHRQVSVVATRTDGTSVSTYTVPQATIATAAQKTAVLNEIWAQHQAALVRDAAIAAFVGNLEVAAKANLEARET